MANMFLTVWNQSLNALTMHSHKQTLCAHTVRKHRNRQSSSKNKTKNQHSNGKSLAVKVTPTFLNKLPPPELCHRTFQEIGYSIFSFFELWCSSVFLWASNNSAKYQRDVPPDTLTFSTLTFTSHKDALVLSKTYRFEDEEVDREEVQHFWTNEEETPANVSNNCNKCDSKPQTDTTSKDAKDLKRKHSNSRSEQQSVSVLSFFLIRFQLSCRC